MVKINEKTLHNEFLRKMIPNLKVDSFGTPFKEVEKKYDSILEKQIQNVKKAFPEFSKKADLETVASVALLKALEKSNSSSENEFRRFLHPYVRMVLIDSLGYFNECDITEGKSFALTGLNEKQTRYYALFLGGLQEEESLMMTLRLYEECSIPEMAAILGKNERQVEKDFNLVIGRMKAGMMVLG